MRRSHRLRLTTLAALAATTLAASTASADTWTVMTYVYADNNLESEAIFNLKQMMKVGTTGNLKVVAQVDREPQVLEGSRSPASPNFSGTKRMRAQSRQRRRVVQDMGTLDNTQPCFRSRTSSSGACRTTPPTTTR